MRRQFLKICSLLVATLLGCSSDLSKKDAEASIRAEIQRQDYNMMTGTVSQRLVPACIDALKRDGASQKTAQYFQVGAANEYHYFSIPTRVQFVEVNSIELVSDFERRVTFAYSVSFPSPPPENKQYQYIPKAFECIKESKALGIFSRFDGKTPIVLSAVAIFKKFSDGWRVEDFISDNRGTADAGAKFVLVPTDTPSR